MEGFGRASLKCTLMKMALLVRFEMALRVSSGMKTSLLRVITVPKPAARSLPFSRCATSSAASFSTMRREARVPLSCPPWPASMTTVLKVREVLRTPPPAQAAASLPIARTLRQEAVA